MGEEGEQVERKRRRTEGEKVGCQSQREVGESQNQKVEEGEEVQGEERDLGGSCSGKKHWGELGEGGLDSAC